MLNRSKRQNGGNTHQHSRTHDVLEAASKVKRCLGWTLLLKKTSAWRHMVEHRSRRSLFEWMTWKSTVVVGYIMATPMSYNSVPRAYFQTPFAVIARFSFGFYFLWFAVAWLISALFWRAMQTYASSTALTQAIWPSCLDILSTIACIT